MIQWGRKATDGNTTTITLPTAFINSKYCISCWSHGSSYTETGAAYTRYGTWARISNTQFQMGSFPNREITFIAVG